MRKMCGLGPPAPLAPALDPTGQTDSAAKMANQVMPRKCQ